MVNPVGKSWSNDDNVYTTLFQRCTPAGTYKYLTNKKVERKTWIPFKTVEADNWGRSHFIGILLATKF